MLESILIVVMITIAVAHCVRMYQIRKKILKSFDTPFFRGEEDDVFANDPWFKK